MVGGGGHNKMVGGGGHNKMVGGGGHNKMVGRWRPQQDGGRWGPQQDGGGHNKMVGGGGHNKMVGGGGHNKMVGGGGHNKMVGGGGHNKMVGGGGHNKMVGGGGHNKMVGGGGHNKMVGGGGHNKMVGGGGHNKMVGGGGHKKMVGGDCSEIINGKEVVPHSLPFMARLEDVKGNLVCGGILINESWVLTAAHCRGIKKVNLGVHSVKNEAKASGQLVAVTKRVPHPDYNVAEFRHDVMLIKLKKPVKLTDTVKVIYLPKPASDVPAGTQCFAAGWGDTKENGAPSDVLLSVNVTVIDRKKCNSPDFYNSYPVITGGMLCAGYGQDKAGTCQGDSGGPLVCRDALRGVVSFAGGCGRVNRPTVYTFISKYTDWITKTIQTSG
ncbi:granzyme A-like [Salvelinus namaycush]|uniref:Granzyme A-like n=1 Tax=Salvelinus namaycush TaxID=8040 RepID=A0A8U0QB95_SALNM|nr:granzyme A-like [Salvelinus namaycush]